MLVFILRKLGHSNLPSIANSSWTRALVWSLIAAAFIGPGTVATAANAGARGGPAYLVVVLLAAIAGFVFMEMAARITMVSGRSLGQLLGGRWLSLLLFGAVVFGCAAYQAGNLLGAYAGLQLLLPTLPRWTLLPIGLLVVPLLWTGGIRRASRVMAYLVAAMGILFAGVALRVVFVGLPSVSLPMVIDSSLLLGLLGTTIVPYNFFLAAGLGSGSGLVDMRRGLFVSFSVGGLITAAVLLIGVAATSFSDFQDLATIVLARSGRYGPWLMGLGLAAAGFSSATTAPLAAAVAGRELLGYTEGGTGHRMVWGGVLGVGLTVALLDLRLLGVILAAQVINGLLLPLIATVVFVLANRRSLLGEEVNRWWQNVAGALVLCFVWYKAAEFLLGSYLRTW